jgi:hypothetical protein
MIGFKSWIVIHSGLGPEFWHLMIALTFYLALALRFDRSVSSRRALMWTIALVLGGEISEGIEKLLNAGLIFLPDVLGDIREGLLWPIILWAFGARIMGLNGAPSAMEQGR